MLSDAETTSTFYACTWASQRKIPYKTSKTQTWLQEMSLILLVVAAVQPTAARSWHHRCHSTRAASGAPVDITTGGHHKHRNTTRGSLPVTTPRALGLLLPRHDLNLKFYKFSALSIHISSNEIKQNEHINFMCTHCLCTHWFPSIHAFFLYTCYTLNRNEKKHFSAKLTWEERDLTGSSSLGRWSAAACRLACSRRVATITSASGLSSQAAEEKSNFWDWEEDDWGMGVGAQLIPAVVNITAPATSLDGSTSTATTSSREDPAGEEGRRRGGAAGIIS
jgi:hypothetical protein